MRRLGLVLGFLFLFSAWQGYSAPLDYSCDSQTLLGVNFKYCINQVDRTKNQDIIYFFHGLHGNAESFFTQKNGTVIIADYWQRHGYEPTVVTISFGDVWLLVNNKRFPLLPFFSNQIMPFLEQKIGGLQQGRRLLMGQSMGGFNAVEASLQLPGTFSKVALMCPAISTISPYATPQEIADYIKRTKANMGLVRLLIAISRSVFQGPADWDKHDPVKLPMRYPAEAVKPEFFVSTGTSDDFGFQEGSELFSATAIANNFSAQWDPVPGNHCHFDRIATAIFMMGD